MTRVQQFIFKFPEFFLVAAVLFYWISSGTLLNPIAIGLIILLIVQFFLRNDFLGVVIPVLLILASIFLLLALFSEYSDINIKNEDSSRLLIVGVPFILTTIAASGLMIRKYTR